MHKNWILWTLLLSTCLLSGCYTSRVRIVLNADGSGTLVVTHTGTEALLSFIETRFKAPADDTVIHRPTNQVRCPITRE